MNAIISYLQDTPEQVIALWVAAAAIFTLGIILLPGLMKDFFTSKKR